MCFIPLQSQTPVLTLFRVRPVVPGCCKSEQFGRLSANEGKKSSVIQLQKKEMKRAKMFPAPTLGMITLTTLLILNILANELHELTMLLTLPHSSQFIACTAMQSIPLSNGHLCSKTSCSLPSLFRLDHPDTGSLGRGNFTASCLTFMKRDMASAFLVSSPGAP